MCKISNKLVKLSKMSKTDVQVFLENRRFGQYLVSRAPLGSNLGRLGFEIDRKDAAKPIIILFFIVVFKLDNFYK